MFFIVGAASTEKGWFRYRIMSTELEVGTLTDYTSDDLSHASDLAFAASIIGAVLSAVTLAMLAFRHWFRQTWANYHNAPLLLSMYVILDSSAAYLPRALLILLSQASKCNCSRLADTRMGDRRQQGQGHSCSIQSMFFSLPLPTVAFSFCLCPLFCLQISVGFYFGYAWALTLVATLLSFCVIIITSVRLQSDSPSSSDLKLDTRT